ncbi:MAG: heme exporter protein CcmB, partial [Gemmatimonadetes bacterium]|nr:heme exporter protein CcmB [Gemmatimonadota bacterium]
VLVAVLFNYAIDRTAVSMQEIAAGLIWMTVVFGGMLGLGRTFQMEEEDGAFQGILLAPIPRDAIYLGKVMANFILLVVVVALVFIVFGVFFDLRFGGEPLVLTLVMLLGVLGFVAIGTLFSAISHRTTMGETLLPILVFPLLVPVVIFGVTATARLFAGRPVAEVSGNVRILAAYAIVGLVAGAGLFRYVVEE